MPDPVIQGVEPPSRADGFLAWIKGHERLVLLAAAAFQVIFLVAMIGLRVTPLLAGDTIFVRVVPVDPRDLFRGDYVVLGYDFSRVPPAGIDGLEESYGQRKQQWLGLPVYVTLCRSRMANTGEPRSSASPNLPVASTFEGGSLAPVGSNSASRLITSRKVRGPNMKRLCATADSRPRLR